MARARNIKPGFFMNDELAEVEPLGRILFAGLWTIADREGRLEDRVKKIRAEVLPYDDCDVENLLCQLAAHGFIIRYSVGQEKYIQITNFSKHQNPHKNEKNSEIPPFREGAQEKHSTSTVQAQEQSSTSIEQEQLMHTTNPADSLNLIPDSLKLISDSHSSDSQSSEEELAEAVKMFEDIVGEPVRSMTDRELLCELVDNYTLDNIKAAMREAAKSGARARNLRYIEGCLKRWKNGDRRQPSTLSPQDKAQLDARRAEEQARYEAEDQERVDREYGGDIVDTA